MHKWRLEQYHSISFWGLDDIYKILKAPNGFEFTLCQVVMSIKLGVDYITPLFVAIDVSTEGEVIIVCDISMKAGAEGILSHLGIYAAHVWLCCLRSVHSDLQSKHEAIPILPHPSLCYRT